MQSSEQTRWLACELLCVRVLLAGEVFRLPLRNALQHMPALCK
jgi:hypothetical protein